MYTPDYHSPREQPKYAIYQKLHNILSKWMFIFYINDVCYIFYMFDSGEIKKMCILTLNLFLFMIWNFLRDQRHLCVICGKHMFSTGFYFLRLHSFSFHSIGNFCFVIDDGDSIVFFLVLPTIYIWLLIYKFLYFLIVFK